MKADNHLSQSQKELLDCARAALRSAYAPYSKFKVGAAVRTESGRVYTGCNVENSSYGLSICAERVAIFKAVSASERKITQLAVWFDMNNPATPCGACRQVIAEFGPEAEILMGSPGSKVRIESIKSLLPLPFDLEL